MRWARTRRSRNAFNVCAAKCEARSQQTRSVFFRLRPGAGIEMFSPKPRTPFRRCPGAKHKSFRPPFSKGGGFQRQRLWPPFADGGMSYCTNRSGGGRRAQQHAPRGGTLSRGSPGTVFWTQSVFHRAWKPGEFCGALGAGGSPPRSAALLTPEHRTFLVALGSPESSVVRRARTPRSGKD